VSNYIYGKEPLHKTVQRLSKFSYDGIEMQGKPEIYNLKKARKLFADHHLSVSSVGAIGLYRLDPSSAKEDARVRAIQYLKECVDFATHLEAPLVAVAATRSAKVEPERSAQAEWKFAVESIRAVGEYAEKAGVSLAVEPVNRYRTYLLNNVDQALKFIDEVGLNSVKIMLDCFHMNIEEPDPVDAVRKAGKQLIHMHVADSNRLSVGRGHLDFKAIVRALKEIGYDRYLTMEIHLRPDPFIPLSEEEADLYTEETIRLLRIYEKIC